MPYTLAHNQSFFENLILDKAGKWIDALQAQGRTSLKGALAQSIIQFRVEAEKAISLTDTSAADKGTDAFEPRKKSF